MFDAKLGPALAALMCASGCRRNIEMRRALD